MRKRNQVLLGAGTAVVGLSAITYPAFLRKPANHPAGFIKVGRRVTTKTLVVCAGAILTGG